MDALATLQHKEVSKLHFIFNLLILSVLAELIVPCCDLCVLKAVARIPNKKEQKLDKFMTRLAQRNIWKAEDNPEDEVPHETKRTGARLKAVREPVQSWRRWILKDWPGCSMNESSILPDRFLTILCSQKHIRTLQDIERAIPDWKFRTRYGEVVLDRIKNADEEWLQEDRAQKLARKLAKTAVTEANKVQRDEARRVKRRADCLEKKESLRTGKYEHGTCLSLVSDWGLTRLYQVRLHRTCSSCLSMREMLQPFREDLLQLFWIRSSISHSRTL